MNRREFLVRSAVASTVLAAARRATAAPEKLRCGLLGLGHGHAIDILKVLQESPDFELVGVCEPDPDMRAFYADNPALKSVRWLERDELLGDDTIRMVAVESRVPRLLGLGREVIDAGKHLHLDKPAGTSLPEFKALLDEAQRRNLLVQMGYMFRYNPGFDLIRKAVTEGWLGDVYAINASMCTDLDPPKRQWASHHPGGMMLELGCHLIDMTVLLLGTPKKVTSYLQHVSKTHNDTLADNTLAVLEYDNALVSIASAAMEPQAFPKRHFKIAGTQGCILLQPLEPPSVHLSLRKPAGEFKAGDQRVVLEDLSRHVRDFAELAACIRGEKEFPYSPQHDYDVQQTVLQASGDEV
ncbi:MAG: Gfo/Idh/MocA family oxidoreductase [FCB group bacterium]|jgi:predicted dehydrogenase|nr:Gfo/Idh/MocA family oxidoreductase [FCB group bacterium]